MHLLPAICHFPQLIQTIINCGALVNHYYFLVALNLIIGLIVAYPMDQLGY